MSCVPRTKRGTSLSLGRDVLKHLSPLNEARAMHDFEKKRLRPDAVPVRRTCRTPSRRLRPLNRRAPARHAHVTTCLHPCSQTVTYAAHSAQRPSCSGSSVRLYRAPSLVPDARSSLVPHPSPIPSSYGCPAGSGRDDVAEGGRRRDAKADLLLKYPNTTVATYV